ncbi:MAG: cyclic di-GMP phosphodiesterase [Thermoleophilales bacterium]|nr:cyclic di-GMP phosphodiesterase [Thermoleophilales bacterium]
MNTAPAVRERVLIVDDDEVNLRILARILGHSGYRCTEARDAERARAALLDAPFDLLLCDVNLPGEPGLDLVAAVLPTYRRMAAVMVSGLDDVALAERALRVGAHGYIVKPFTASEVLMGVLGALSHRQRELDANERLSASHEETIRRLCIAVEARDPDIAEHVNQMSEYCWQLAGELGLDADRCALIRTASAMHDVGKIGVADRILLKPGPLDSAERAEMERHAEIGYRIMGGSTAELLQRAATIAWTHHEKFDGTGYPRGLAGDDIPLEGRVAAVADVFDALTRDRVYRDRFSRADALGVIRDSRGTHFDGDIADAFLGMLDRDSATTGSV